MKFLSYAVVGGACTMLNLALLWLLTSALGLHYLVSTMISFFSYPRGFLAAKAHYLSHAARACGHRMARYFATMGSSFAANLGLMYVLVSLLGVWYLAASLIVTLLLLATNFLVNDRWSFALRR